MHVVTSNNKEGRGIYSVGTVLINDGTVHVEAAGNAYAMKRDGGTFAVNGGKFNINGSSSYINYGADADANIAIKGGYYSLTTDSQPLFLHRILYMIGQVPENPIITRWQPRWDIPLPSKTRTKRCCKPVHGWKEQRLHMPERHLPNRAIQRELGCLAAGRRIWCL